ncbi:prolyl oligopeptidase family serine peptidase [Rhodococcus sp. SGAir0479]|uniref:prolyl oligopeptidase family serine peptidase n=1 Tax=Rhodococcus sp. SGAir0479 TaxID=2567884 RepID=UPI0010CD20F4|nr:prolyl oligopeptidase family serine peptidase [Rhodococcus sp. SGAir0479]QCQ92545.1 S9 family peptidase [Rhodococcus sp. SGAir0479]
MTTPAPTVTPYGSWISPITAADLAASGHPVEGGVFVGDGVWWSEQRPVEGGRSAVRRLGPDGEPVDVLPPPWNARTRVHEYGGGAWAVTPDAVLVFAEFTDQRLYRFDPHVDAAPVPITPAPPTAAAHRYGDLTIVGDEVWCVRERHDDGVIVRDICAVPVDGRADDDPSALRSIVGGSIVGTSDFLAYPRVSPDGARVAWIAWNHPQMPWDGTELRVLDLASGAVDVLLGGPEESVLQPEWEDASTLRVVSDRSGWWNLYRVTVDGGDLQPLCPTGADFGAPLWQLGARWHVGLDDGAVLTARTVGTDTLAVLDPGTGALRDLELDGISSVGICDVDGNRILLRCGGSRIASGLRILDLDSGALTDVRLSVDTLPDVEYLPEARALTFDGPEREVHAIVYPPRNPDHVAPDGELPPYVAFVHGGPTAHVAPAVHLVYAYFTSRGIGVVDVNYGGSSGYGREYRNRLRGQWGVVDVEDTVAAVRGLADAGLADPRRLAIEGGSAGGWTVLSALTTSDVFACGVSYYGVAELVEFVKETHDFESRYIDGLIGPLPEAAELYERRAPVNNVDGLSCPVLLLQGLSDPIVPPSQAERFRAALVRKQLPHAYLAYAGESHGFRRVETIVNAREAELSFYGQVLGFDTPGIPRLELWRP